MAGKNGESASGGTFDANREKLATVAVGLIHA
jgi:hypothetical protein